MEDLKEKNYVCMTMSNEKLFYIAQSLSYAYLSFLFK